jgi:hypothetical protein
MQSALQKPVVLFVLFGLISAGPAYGVSDNFSTNPLASGSPWSFGVGDNSHTQFTWSAAALSVHLNSSLPTARLDHPLGETLGDAASFVLSARFSFHITRAPTDQALQIAFGLTNHTQTGGDRTGSFANSASDSTFHTVEFNYFPEVVPAAFEPTLSPAIFGGPNGGDAFGNFAAVFGSANNVVLPQDTTLEAHLEYDGTSKLATLTAYQVAGGGSLVLVGTPVTLDLGIFGGGYDPTHPFQVDTLSIMAYHDGYTTAANPSLVADVTYQNISLVVPEPSALALATAGSLAVIVCGVRLRRLSVIG